MSYRKPDTGNSINDLFSSMTDFVMLSPNLLNAGGRREFEIWLEKLEAIDRRSLYFFLKKHKGEIPKEHMELAERRFWEDL